MKKGVSPVVAIVLLIAIAVVAATGLYFWSGGLATKQPTPEVPIAIFANPIDASSGRILIANLGSESLTVGELQTTDSTFSKCLFDGEVTLGPGEQATCTLATANNVTGPAIGSMLIFGPSVGSTGVNILTGKSSNDVTSEEIGQLLDEAVLNIPFKTRAGSSFQNWFSFPFEADGTILSIKSVRKISSGNNAFGNSTFNAHDFLAAFDTQDCNNVSNPLSDVARFNILTGSFEAYHPLEGGQCIGINFTFEEGIGYYANTKANADETTIYLEVRGTPPSGEQRHELNHSINPRHYFGWVSLQGGTLSDITFEPEGCYNSIKIRDADTDTWVNTTQFEPGQAYQIDINQNCNMTYFS